MIVWVVAALSIGSYTALFHFLEVWLAFVVSVVLLIQAGIGNLARIGAFHVSPKKR